MVCSSLLYHFHEIVVNFVTAFEKIVWKFGFFNFVARISEKLQQDISMKFKDSPVTNFLFKDISLSPLFGYISFTTR